MATSECQNSLLTIGSKIHSFLFYHGKLVEGEVLNQIETNQFTSLYDTIQSADRSTCF